MAPSPLGAISAVRARAPRRIWPKTRIHGESADDRRRLQTRCLQGHPRGRLVVEAVVTAEAVGFRCRAGQPVQPQPVRHRNHLLPRQIQPPPARTTVVDHRTDPLHQALGRVRLQLAAAEPPAPRAPAERKPGQAGHGHRRAGHDRPPTGAPPTAPAGPPTPTVPHASHGRPSPPDPRSRACARRGSTTPPPRPAPSRAQPPPHTPTPPQEDRAPSPPAHHTVTSPAHPIRRARACPSARDSRATSRQLLRSVMRSRSGLAEAGASPGRTPAVLGVQTMVALLAAPCGAWPGA